MLDYEIFELGDVELQMGATLRNAKLAYKTYGSLDQAKSNAIGYPSWYSGQHYENEWLIGNGGALDPARYFIIVPNMFGNGLSSSPSNTPPPYDRARFPLVTVYDNVSVQHRLVTERFGIQRLQLVTGWSMGGGQTYQWAVSYPEMVPRILPFCGSARTSRHNFVFLEGIKGALTADAAFQDGWYEKPPNKGLRAFSRVYADGAFRKPSTGSSCIRSSGTPRSRTSWSASGRTCSSGGTPTTCSRCCGRGSTAISARPLATTNAMRLAGSASANSLVSMLKPGEMGP